MDLDLAVDGTRLELKAENTVADIFEIHEKTKFVFTGTIRKDDGTVEDPATWALFFGVFDKPGGTLIKSFDTASAIVAATNLFTMTIDPNDISVAEDVVAGQYEFVAFSGGSLSGDPTGRVKGLAIIREANKE